MRKAYIYIIMCICLLASVSCDSDKKKGPVTAKVQSAPYELLVVVNKEWLKTTDGEQFKQMVESPIEGLPQQEPYFRTTYIFPHAFSSTFRTYANILVVESGSKYSRIGLRQATNVYAQPQVIMYLEAPNTGALIEAITTYKDRILHTFNENEFVRERTFLSRNYAKTVHAEALKQFGVSIKIPEVVDAIKKGKDFMWASDTQEDFRQNLCLYMLPMRGLTVENLVEARDSVMKINIPGGNEEQWMETDRRSVMGGMTRVGNRDVLMIRGLWDMRRDAMGGPFVCYAYPDSVNQRVVVAEGFVFAPNKAKRAYVRQMEAALRTMIVEGNTQK